MSRTFLGVVLTGCAHIAGGEESDTGSCSATSEAPVYTLGTGEGTACASAAEGGVEVRVSFDECVVCSHAVTATCTVTQDGDRLVVASSAEIDPGQCACGSWDECFPVDAVCGTAVAPGEYTLVYGDAEAAVTVDVTTEVCTP